MNSKSMVLLVSVLALSLAACGSQEKMTAKQEAEMQEIAMANGKFNAVQYLSTVAAKSLGAKSVTVHRDSSIGGRCNLLGQGGDGALTATLYNEDYRVVGKIDCPTAAKGACEDLKKAELSDNYGKNKKCVKAFTLIESQ